MTAIVTCTACQYGEHQDHVHVVQAAPEGGFGGAVCLCEGECESADARNERARQYTQRYVKALKHVCHT